MNLFVCFFFIFLVTTFKACRLLCRLAAKTYCLGYFLVLVVVPCGGSISWGRHRAGAICLIFQSILVCKVPWCLAVQSHGLSALLQIIGASEDLDLFDVLVHGWVFCLDCQLLWDTIPAQLFFNTSLSELSFSVCTIIHALSTIEEIQIFALALVKCFAI